MSLRERVIYNEYGAATAHGGNFFHRPVAVTPCICSGYFKMGARNFLYTKKADGFSAPAVMIEYD